MTNRPAFTESPSGRRSQRILECVVVMVHGMLSYKIPFQEETETLVISAHGALVSMATIVTPRQKIIVRHKQTREEKECTVAYLGPVQGGKTLVGLEFTLPDAGFWRIAAPPEDWAPSNPAT